MPYSKEDIEELDRVLKRIMGEGELNLSQFPRPVVLLLR